MRPMPRLLDIVQKLPLRLWRLGRHFSQFKFASAPRWLLEFFLQILDALGIGDLYDASASILKRARKLTQQEKQLATSIFGDSLPLEKIRVDERALLGPRQGRFCYVSFYTINSWGEMSDAVFVHELVHIWQYHHLGVVYIPRALAAQWSRHGYDYGGAAALQKAIAEGKPLLDFNYEQQASIVEDYFRIKHGQRPMWSRLLTADLPVFEHFVTQLQYSPVQQ